MQTKHPTSPQSRGSLNAEHRTHSDKFILTAILLVYTLVILKRAWMSDDAYITLRTVDNFISGHGLRWNVVERVQVYTHPLWMLLHCVLMFITREAYYTSLFLSVACSLGAVALLAQRVASNTQLAFLASTILVGATGFVDFSTSGLENPLTHLLLVVFAWQYLKPLATPHHLQRLAITAGLLALNRMDAILLLLPALLDATLATATTERKSTGRLRQSALAMGVGIAPFLAWQLFSLVYYGFFLPNTAYAKLVGISSEELLAQGFGYYLSTLARDPCTLLGIALGLAAAVWWRQRKHLCLAVGIIAHLLYILRIGGDFMLSRFLSPPLMLAACLIASVPKLIELRWASAIAILIVTVGLSAPGTPLGIRPEETRNFFDEHKVADERAFYVAASGLMHAERGKAMPDHPWAHEGRKARAEANPTSAIPIRPNVGYFGYFAGPSVFILNDVALTDPLLARLPAQRDIDWRPGHLGRIIPAGYVATLENTRNGQQYQCSMPDEALCRYYEKLQLVTRGPLFSAQRLATVLGFAVNRYDSWIDQQSYALPYLVRVDSKNLPDSAEENAPWDTASSTVFHDSGLDVLFPEATRVHRWELSLDSNDRYRLIFYQGPHELSKLTLEPSHSGGLHKHTVSVPQQTAEKGYDRIRILPMSGDHRYSLGHLRPL